MDSESLDRCIQTALSSLYPPFQATSPTVLCQVLSVVENCYRGDGLRYLIHFLLPAKQLLANLQQDACLQYCGLLFRHEGWPLCIHEKVVVQLCPLDQRLLRPGDFYLLISPPAAPLRAHGASCRSAVASVPRLLLCSVSSSSRHVEQQEVPELALRSLFSMAWLDSVNREREQRGASRLERLLLCARGDVFRVPWEDLVYPQLLSQPRPPLKEDRDSDVLINVTHSSCPDVKLLPPAAKTDQSAASSEGEDSEGEYVELTELPLPRFSPQKGSLTQTIILQHRGRTSMHGGTQGAAHTPHTPHSAAHTPHTPHSAAHTPHTPHSAAHTPHTQHTPHSGTNTAHTPHTPHSTTHTPHTPHSTTHTPHSTAHTPQSAAHTPENTLSSSAHSWPCLDVRTRICSGLITENLNQDSCGPVILTPISSSSCSSSSSSAPPPPLGATSFQMERWTLQGGGDSGTEQRGKEHQEEEEERGETEREEREYETVVLVDEGEKEKEEEEESLDTQASEEGEEDESEEGEEELDEEEDEELEDDGAEEVEVEEEVQVIIVQQSQERREVTEDEREEDETPGLNRELSWSTGPAEPEPAAASTVPAQPPQPPPSSQSHHQSSFYSVLLSSGAVCLPGSSDRSGHALLTVCTSSAVWSHPDCDGAQLLRLLRYYASTLRPQVRALGMTVLVDARGAAPAPALFSALRTLQVDTAGSVHSVILLVNKDSSIRVDKPAATQVEVLSSLKALQKLVVLQQLPVEFGGSVSFSQSSWLCFRSRVEQLTSQCDIIINLLQKTINLLQPPPLPAAAQDAELLLSRYQAVMRSVLEDRGLVELQQGGGASLSRLRSVMATEEQRAAVQQVSALYEQVDELLHRLVMLSNARTQQLHLQQDLNRVRVWLQQVGLLRLQTLEEEEDSLELLRKKLQDFKEFHTSADEQCRRAEALLARVDRCGSADLQDQELAVRSLWTQMQDFSRRVHVTGQNLERAVRLYSFLDQAYGWALKGMRHLAAISMEECTAPDKCLAVIGCLEDYDRQHPPIPESSFQEMKAAAGELRGERGLRQWSFAWSKCQETKKMFDRKMEAALRTRDSAHRRRSDSTASRSSASSRRSLSGLWGVHETSFCSPEGEAKPLSPPRNASSSSLLSISSSPAPITSSPLTSSPLTPKHTPLLQRLIRSASSEESSDRIDISSSSPSLPRLASSSSSRRQQLRKTQSFDCPSPPEVSRFGPCPRAHSEPVRRGNTGVFIRGLEVSSTEATDRTLCPRTAAHGWAGRGACSPGTPRTTGSPATDSRPRGSKLRHVVEEMVTTEQEYVRSLRYTIQHYFPEMERADLPQDLRGKRSVVFGNLEKLLDFHSQFFLRELEACWRHPLRVPHCFLRHQEQFGLYALYSKNKPKSDALLAQHGNSFFRRKQVELGDKLDLSSYLLKPVQRMSKYALLLCDLMKEVGGAQEAELLALQDATNMVKFQLRHGNDLLAMDAIRDCDVNLKEQGQLIRQDEFTVWTGRRKSQRHVFLFEELVLFSKPKKMEGGLDVFIYKHSFKTADVGLTESTGDDGLRFEIWFRRRTSKNQTFILQAASADVKHAWTADVARILWTQATRNKEMRLKEMVSMGVGNKPFLDIQPSDAAISDRAVHYIMKSRGARTRASIAVSVFDHSNPFKRGAVTSDPTTSGPSSSSLLGPLNLHIYSHTLPSPPAAEGSFITSCIEEDEQEHETSSQPSMTTESSGSSSRCLSGSTGSDSGCVSSHLQEALPEEQSSQLSSCTSSCTSHKQLLSSQYSSPKASPLIGPASVV